MDETTIDERGRIVVPQNIREHLDLRAGTVLKIDKRGKEIVMKPVRRKKKTMKDLCGLDPERTGEPEWATPEEIKGIWE